MPPSAPAALAISGANGTATVGDTTSFTPTISGGATPYTVVAAGLPPGRSISNAATGLTTGAYTTADTYASVVYTVTDSLGATASMTRSVVVSAAFIINMTGAAARVAITDVSYWIRTGGVLARSTDAAYEANLKASSTAKTIPSPAAQPIPSGSIGYVSIKHDDVTADISPPLYINWDGNSTLPASAPVAPTVWYSADSVTGSPDDGAWTQDTSFVLFRPTSVTDQGYNGRGQRYFWPTTTSRWVQVRFDVTASGATQAMSPHIACSSGQWMWVIGNSVIRNQYSSISTINAQRAAMIAVVSGSDPFFFATARSGSNQQSILDEQVDPVLASATLKKFLRGAYCNPWLGDIAFSGVRPYSTASQATRDGIRARSDSIFTKVKSLGLTVVASDMTWGNYTATSPINGDLMSANGNVPWMLNVTGPGHRASLPSSWDNGFDWPIVSQAASMANIYETGLADEVHPNTVGFSAFRLAEYPNWRLLYGIAAGINTMQSIVTELGATATPAKKARAQAMFALLEAAYPTAIGSAISNRAALKATLDAIPEPSTLTNLTGGAARVAITDASYWIRTGGVLSRTTDTAYETNLKASSTAKTTPYPTTQPIPAGSIGYVSIKHADVNSDTSPPLYINWDGNSALPTAASPVAPTVWYSGDSVNGSPDSGTWIKDTSFALYRPTSVTDAAYNGRGQRYFWPTVAARWVQVRFDVSVSGATQVVTPQVVCSSGQWIWTVGMSIIRNQYSSLSTVSASRAAVIAQNAGADPFFFVSARSGANQQAIIDEQVTPIVASSSLRRFVRGIYANFWINDLAFTSVRPYSSTAQAVRDAIGQRSTSILSSLKSLGLTLVVSDCTYGNYGAATPAVVGDLSSANGNLPFITNVLGPIHKAQLPSAFDATYDWPIVSQYAAMGNTYDTAMADEVHPNGTGYTPQFKTTEIPHWRMLYGQNPGVSTMQSIITSLGSSTTPAKKARAQATFIALDAAYPTAISSAITSRANLNATLENIPVA